MDIPPKKTDKHHIPHYHNDESHPENTSIYIYWLVVSTPSEKKTIYSQLGLLFPRYGKIKFMFQTNNQYKNSIHMLNY